jgi:hypothetical protein
MANNPRFHYQQFSSAFVRATDFSSTLGQINILIMAWVCMIMHGSAVDQEVSLQKNNASQIGIFAMIRSAVFTFMFATSLFCVPANAQGLLKSLTESAKQIISPSASGGNASVLGSDEIINGLREALRVGAQTVVGQLGTTDGYNTDTAIHISLPSNIQKAQDLMRKFGLSALADDVELRINRAAEAAAPKTKELIWRAIEEMTLDDAKRIYNGPNDAATQYFRRVSTDDLSAAVKPVVDQALREVGAIAAYDSLVGQYSKMPFVPDIKSDLSAHAVQGALSGLFHYLAKEEAAIRDNPAKQTTDLLKRVFGD